MTRSEHMTWCKQRALEYVDKGETLEALTSMGSDLDMHEETKGHVAVDLGLQLYMIGSITSVPDMRRYIEGFN